MLHFLYSSRWIEEIETLPLPSLSSILLTLFSHHLLVRKFFHCSIEYRKIRFEKILENLYPVGNVETMPKILVFSVFR